MGKEYLAGLFMIWVVTLACIFGGFIWISTVRFSNAALTPLLVASLVWSVLFFSGDSVIEYFIDLDKGRGRFQAIFFLFWVSFLLLRMAQLIVTPHRLRLRSWISTTLVAGFYTLVYIVFEVRWNPGWHSVSM